jgi:muramoyltetrapeptide carboxypeptidase LdcA involved in peptidoglycan recycling
MKAFVWAPSNNGLDLKKENRDLGLTRLKKMGYEIIMDNDINQDYLGLGINKPSKLIAFYQEFINTNDSVLIPLYGGYSSNLILEDIVKVSNFKENQLVSGKSDLTSLLNALYKQTGVRNLHGVDLSKICNPNLTLQEIKVIERSLKRDNITVGPPSHYNDGYWYLSERGYYPHGRWDYFYRENLDYISGRLIGGNLESLSTLIGTKFLPDFKDKIIVIEAIPDVYPTRFLMNLKHLIMTSNLLGAKALLIGKFSPNSILSDVSVLYNLLVEELKIREIPIIYNIDFSHTEPSFPFYIGGTISINFNHQEMEISFN